MRATITLFKRAMTITGILFFILLAVGSIASSFTEGAVGSLVMAQLVAASDGTVYELMGNRLVKKKGKGGGNYVKGSIRGGVRITTAVAQTYSVFGANQQALNTQSAGSGVLTNQTGQAGTYGEEGHIIVKALKFGILNLTTTAVDFFTSKTLAQYATATFTMGGYTLWEDHLYKFIREDVVTYNTNAPADSVLVSNVFNTISLGNDGYKINKGDSFSMNINLSAAVALPAGELTSWYFTCSLDGKKTLPQVAKA